MDAEHCHAVAITAAMHAAEGADTFSAVGEVVEIPKAQDTQARFSRDDWIALIAEAPQQLIEPTEAPQACPYCEHGAFRVSLMKPRPAFHCDGCGFSGDGIDLFGLLYGYEPRIVAVELLWAWADERGLSEEPGEQPRHIANPERWKTFLPPAWVALEIPPRDWLLEEMLCTTSRWLVVGETGVGKTLILLDMAHAICKGVGFLNWEGVDWQGVKRERPFRVMYVDGELPAETMKERLAEAARLYGADLEVVVYNRDRLGMDELPPLNTEAGREWLIAEVEAVKPDCIILDNVMALLSGKMDDEQWEAVKPLIAQLMARRVAQIWVHHPGHDTSRGFGSKTREWHMDVVINLTRESEDDSDRIRLKFTKARMKRPETAHLYRELVIRRTDVGWQVETAPRRERKPASKHEMIQSEVLNALDELQEGVGLTPGFNGAPVRKVKMTLVTELLKRNGTLQTAKEDDPASGITNSDRQALSTARLALKRKRKIAMEHPYMWRL